MFYRTYSDEAGAEGSFLFPVYLQQKVANYDPVIIRQIWERYRTNSGSGDVEKAIDDVLDGYNHKSLKTEFPLFAWNNYFLNAGTYQ